MLQEGDAYGRGSFLGVRLRAGGGGRILLAMLRITMAVTIAAVVFVVPAACATKQPVIRVAVVDSGVAPVGSLAKVLDAGTDVVDSTGSTVDVDGHGTEMAGVVHRGCPACRIVPVKALNDSGLGSSSAAASGIRWALAQHVQVINLSLTEPAEDPDLTAAIEAAVHAGVVVVLAAGNSGSAAPSDQGYPGAAAPDALTVSAVDASGRLDFFSNYGPWAQIAAPEAFLVPTVSGQSVWAEGTSAAAAYTSGVVGMMLRKARLSPAAVKAIVVRTGRPVRMAWPSTTVWSGRGLNAAAAIAAA